MVDVLLTHSYHLFYDRKQVRKMQPYPPLGTLYAAALLRERGYSVAVFDAMLEDPERGFPEALEWHRPRIVAIYEDNFNFLSKMCLSRMRQVAFGMGDAARAAGATVVVNGSDPSDHIEEYLGRGFDFVLLGEAEWTLEELVKAVLEDSEREPAQVAGLAFRRRATGEIYRTPSRPQLRDLDALPLPARDLIDLGRYREAWKARHGFFSLNLVASRGCPYRCNWCARPIYGESFHIRSAESVAEEMQQLKDVYGADHLWFADDLFSIKPRWVVELAGAVERRNAALPFKMQSRINLMTPETTQALKRAGCVEVWMGVESGSQKILDAMDKGTRVEQVAVARRHLHQQAIRACYFLQFGYPGENWHDIQQTVRLVRETRPDDVGISVSYPLPGTKFYERVREELGAKRQWVDSDDLAMMFRGGYTDEFYRALHDALHAEVETWSPPAANAFNTHPQAEAKSGESRSLGEHWSRVEQLEKTCRSAEPTFAPPAAAPLASFT